MNKEFILSQIKELRLGDSEKDMVKTYCNILWNSIENLEKQVEAEKIKNAELLKEIQELKNDPED